MKQNYRLTFIILLLESLLCATWLAAAAGAETREFARLRERFASPPPGSGTVTLYWLNGTITKEGIREQMRALRDQCGFGGVAPLTFHAMQPATQPPYLSELYFDVYGCILDTAKELGMAVVFYDDCDFPSGSAGNQMRQRHPESLLKYLARSRAMVTGPGEAVIAVPNGVLMGVVAKNLDDGKRGVVTDEASWADAPPSWTGRSVGFRQPVEEAAIFEHLRLLGDDGKVLHEDRFAGNGTLPREWTSVGAARLESGGLRASGCLPMWRTGLMLPDRFTLETRFTIVNSAAGLAFVAGDADDFYFWQFHAGAKAIRPHHKQGNQHTLLDAVPFAFVPGRAYDVRLAVDGNTVTTWIDGQRVAVHRLAEEQRKTVRWKAPAGRWEVQTFVCATVPNTRVWWTISIHRPSSNSSR